MLTKEDKTIIYRALKSYLIVYVSTMLIILIITGGKPVNRVAAIPILILALRELKKGNMLIIKTILIAMIITTTLFFVYFLLFSKSFLF